MMEALKIVADSWPIAFMVLGLAAAYVIRQSLHQSIDAAHTETMDRAKGNQAVVVSERRPHADD